MLMERRMEDQECVRVEDRVVRALKCGVEWSRMSEWRVVSFVDASPA